ncbi:hypothetical protein J3Q64DRAFT_1840674 [Phycomyces blakesleeanus]|uniref:Uncharacterized protein n=2 Tax=Phycomyces blakesleeanus TaxID=4837 RepID=A0A163DA87_PHYB8|nr:hypothetical protein PHYBLDRAFT_149089 [Phycomyces blakesleeanus NRRL 1555(-)]OAD69910.1 hypothetical protein PHYBLDRAFT_149089 [Phycomyces blakesleeanus NRRL 1555(-)]|eukprot:XP_018287950.1 hypothetical protein PHYBLDRAFT_149089 [Phycomyces blakesleeanus NRRL 1555(-)]
MHEESTVETPRCYRYTSNQQNIRLKKTKFRRILQDLKAQAPNVIAAEHEISQTSERSNNITDFAFHTSVKAANSSILSSFYTNTVSRTTQKPLFRKLRLSSYINKRKANERLAKYIRAKFGQDCVLTLSEMLPAVPSDRQVSPQPEPISPRPNTNCDTPWSPKANSTTTPFLSSFILTSTFRYTNLNCLKKTDGSEDRNRLWNRELTAVLNFWHILNRLRYNSIIPEKFTRVIQIGRIRRSSGGSSFETKTD